MRVALLGATGPVGKRILSELLSRGHQVTAVVRNASNVPVHPNVIAQSSDVSGTDDWAKTLVGHDAIILSIRFLKTDPDAIIAATHRAGIKRLLCVGGAGGLYMPGTKTKVIDSGLVPDEFMEEPRAGIRFLERLRQEHELEWTFVAPPLMFSNDESWGFEPGGRTGHYRRGSDEPLFREDGKSTISYEDFAVAMVDELENGAHVRERFTVGY